MSNHRHFDNSLTRREWLRRAGVLSGSAVLVAAWPEWAFAFHGQPAAATDQIAAMRAQLGATPITAAVSWDRT